MPDTDGARQDGLGAGLDRSTFANFAEAREAAYEQKVIPAQGDFAEELRHQLLALVWHVFDLGRR